MKTLLLILIFIFVASYAYITVSERQKQRQIKERRPKMREMVNKQEFRKALYQLRHTKRKKITEPENTKTEEQVEKPIDQEENLPYDDDSYYNQYDAETLKKQPSTSARPIKNIPQEGSARPLPRRTSPPSRYDEPMEIEDDTENNYPPAEYEDSYPEYDSSDTYDTHQQTTDTPGGKASLRFDSSEKDQETEEQYEEDNLQENRPSLQDINEEQEETTPEKPFEETDMF